MKETTYEYKNDSAHRVKVQLRAEGVGFRSGWLSLEPGDRAGVIGPEGAAWWVMSEASQHPGAAAIDAADMEPAWSPLDEPSAVEQAKAEAKAQTRAVLEHLSTDSLMTLIRTLDFPQAPPGTGRGDFINMLDQVDIRKALCTFQKYRLVSIARSLGVVGPKAMRKEDLVEDIIRLATRQDSSLDRPCPLREEDGETPDLLIQSGYEEAAVALHTWPAPSAGVLASIRRAAEQLGYDARYGRADGRWRAEVATKRGAASQVVDVSLAQTEVKRDAEWWAGFSALGLVGAAAMFDPHGLTLEGPALTPDEVKGLAAAVQRA